VTNETGIITELERSKSVYTSSSNCSAWSLIGYSDLFAEKKYKVQLWWMIGLYAPFKRITLFQNDTD